MEKRNASFDLGRQLICLRIDSERMGRSLDRANLEALRQCALNVTEMRERLLDLNVRRDQLRTSIDEMLSIGAEHLCRSGLLQRCFRLEKELRCVLAETEALRKDLGA